MNYGGMMTPIEENTGDREKDFNCSVCGAKVFDDGPDQSVECPSCGQLYF
jgi:rubrerythrin